MGKERPFYRSGYERKFMEWCDKNDNVIEWGYEPFFIPYIFELDPKKKVRRYYIDFFCKVKDRNGNIIKYLIEIKPYKQTIKPTEPKRKSDKSLKRYQGELYTYVKNVNKWNAATSLCSKKGYKFMILTEKHLFQENK